jgi:hypothetical protein
MKERFRVPPTSFFLQDYEHRVPLVPGQSALTLLIFSAYHFFGLVDLPRRSCGRRLHAAIRGAERAPGAQVYSFQESPVAAAVASSKKIV